MKKTILIGLIAGITGLTIGYKVPKDKNWTIIHLQNQLIN